MAKLYNGGYTYPNGISVAAGKPLDDRLVLNSVEDLYINSSTRNAGTAVLNKIAYTGMPVIIANNGNPYVVLLKNSEPYENGSTTEVNASNYTTYWTIPGKSVEDYISGTIDPSINKLGIHLEKTDSSIVILNSSVSVLESHISNTDSSVSTLDSSFNELNTSLGQLYVDFESFGNDMTYSINTLNSSYNNLVDEIIDNEKVFAAALTELNDKITENDVRDYISGTIDPSINKLETHLEKTDSSIVILNSSVSNLETHISKTDSSVDVLETHIGEVDTFIEALNSSVSTFETHISNTIASVSTLDSSVNVLETHVSEIDTSIEALNSSVSTFETHISNTIASVSTLDSSVNVLENHISKTDVSINTINSSINELETRVGTVDTSILDSSVSNLEIHISNTDAFVSTLDSSLNELNTSLGQLYVDFESFGNDVTYSINTLNSSYNNLVDEIVANEEVVAAAITDLNEKIAENDVRDYISGTIDPSINKLETEITQHGNKLNNYADTFPQNPVASSESNGLMSAADKAKVDNYPEQFVLDLGIVESQAYGEREAAKSEVAGNRNISFIRFQVHGVHDLKTTLIMQWPNGINETAQIMCVDKQQWRRNVTGATGVVGATTNAYNWSRTAPHSIVYDEQSRIIQLKDYQNEIVSQGVELPLAMSSKPGLMSSADKIKLDRLVIDTTWDEQQHMNAFTETGEYHIHGIRTRDNDGLPIINSGGGHTIDALLTVLDSSLTGGTGAKTDICVTQILRLSNRTGGDGHVFVRTGQAATKEELKTDNTKWSAWEKLMGLFEKSMVTNIDDLNTYTTNGMYSGMFMNTESKSLGGLQFNQGDTFLIVTVNGYAASAFGTAQLTQMLYLLPTKKDNATAKMYLRTAYWDKDASPKAWVWANWDRIVTASELSALEAQVADLKTRVEKLEAK